MYSLPLLTGHLASDLIHARTLLQEVPSLQALLQQQPSSSQTDLALKMVRSAYELCSILMQKGHKMREQWLKEAIKRKILNNSGYFNRIEHTLGHIVLLWLQIGLQDNGLKEKNTEGTRIYLNDMLLPAMVLGEGHGDHEINETLEAAQSAILFDEAVQLPSSTLDAIMAGVGNAFDFEHQRTVSERDAVRWTALQVMHVLREKERACVVLVSLDRVLTRKVCSLLDEQGIKTVDHGGQKLSTTVVAAFLQSLLKMASPAATYDDILNALVLLSGQIEQNADPQVAEVVQTLHNYRMQVEHSIRQGIAALTWNALLPTIEEQLSADDWLWHQRIASWRRLMQNHQSLREHITGLKRVLQEAHLWSMLQMDAVGSQILQALCINSDESFDENTSKSMYIMQVGDASHSLAEFQAWVDTLLEHHNLSITSTDHAPMLQENSLCQVHVMDWAHMNSENWSILQQNHSIDEKKVVTSGSIEDLPVALMVGADEKRLNFAVVRSTLWSARERAWFGLQTDVQYAQEAVQRWLWLLKHFKVRAVSHALDENLNALQVSPLVKITQHIQTSKQLLHSKTQKTVPLCENDVDRAWSDFVEAYKENALAKEKGDDQGQYVSAPHLLPQKLSSSAYSMLRTCPYQFFAAKMLNLQAVELPDEEMMQREFGIWIHEILKLFHEHFPPQQLHKHQKQGEAFCQNLWNKTLHELAQKVAFEQSLPEDALFPWWFELERIKEAYIDYLFSYEWQKIEFSNTETKYEKLIELDTNETIQLHGKIDRMDICKATQEGKEVIIYDYKTEALEKTKGRVNNDIQLTFYVSMQQPKEQGATLSNIQAAYLNLGSRKVEPVVVENVGLHTQQLLQEITKEMSSIARGEVLEAKQNKLTCQHCDFAGVCRKPLYGIAQEKEGSVESGD